MSPLSELPHDPIQAVEVWRWPNALESGAIPVDEPISMLMYASDEEPINELLAAQTMNWLAHRYNVLGRVPLPAPKIVEFTAKNAGTLAKWADRPADSDAVIDDHERNPEYEVHVGQVTADGRRMASIWLQGTRWTGWLDQGDPRWRQHPAV